MPLSAADPRAGRISAGAAARMWQNALVDRDSDGQMCLADGENGMLIHCVEKSARWRCGWTAIRQILVRVISLCTLYSALHWRLDVGLAGVFPGKALLTINGGAPRTVAVGSENRLKASQVLSVDNDTATIEIVDR
jgi:hypothetical protein